MQRNSHHTPDNHVRLRTFNEAQYAEGMDAIREMDQAAWLDRAGCPLGTPIPEEVAALFLSAHAIHRRQGGSIHDGHVGALIAEARQLLGVV